MKLNKLFLFAAVLIFSAIAFVSAASAERVRDENTYGTLNDAIDAARGHHGWCVLPCMRKGMHNNHAECYSDDNQRFRSHDAAIAWKTKLGTRDQVYCGGWHVEYEEEEIAEAPPQNHPYQPEQPEVGSSIGLNLNVSIAAIEMAMPSFQGGGDCDFSQDCGMRSFGGGRGGGGFCPPQPRCDRQDFCPPPRDCPPPICHQPPPVCPPSQPPGPTPCPPGTTPRVQNEFAGQNPNRPVYGRDGGQIGTVGSYNQNGPRNSATNMASTAGQTSAPSASRGNAGQTTAANRETASNPSTTSAFNSNAANMRRQAMNNLQQKPQGQSQFGANQTASADSRGTTATAGRNFANNSGNAIGKSNSMLRGQTPSQARNQTLGNSKNLGLNSRADNTARRSFANNRMTGNSTAQNFSRPSKANRSIGASPSFGGGRQFNATNRGASRPAGFAQGGRQQHFARASGGMGGGRGASFGNRGGGNRGGGKRR